MAAFSGMISDVVIFSRSGAPATSNGVHFQVLLYMPFPAEFGQTRTLWPF